MEQDRPQPYKVDEKTYRTQTIERDGERRVRFRHDFLRLDMSNFDLLLKREKETVRYSEKMGKGRARPHYDEHKADSNFYKALVVGGGWRPAELGPVTDLELVPEQWRSLYTQLPGEKDPTFRPGWNELNRDRMLRFTPERMKNAVDAFLACKAEYVPDDGDDISFMFEEGGLMRFNLLVGDPDAPAFVVPTTMRRPESQRRTAFRTNFAYSVDHTQAEGGKTETVMNYSAGTTFFAEHFATIADDPQCSEVLFEQQRVSDEPRAISAVSNDDVPHVPDVRIIPYNDSLRGTLIQTLNPIYQVELASAVVLQYSQTDRE